MEMLFYRIEHKESMKGPYITGLIPGLSDLHNNPDHPGADGICGFTDPECLILWFIDALALINVYSCDFHVDGKV